jgi:rRNA-processing protein FCF1
MSYETSFSNPHTIFLSEEKRDELNTAVGTPVSIVFEEYEDPVVAKVADPEDISTEEELYSLIYTLHYTLDEIDDLHAGLFSDFNSTEYEEAHNITSSIKNVEGFRSYINKIHHLLEYRLPDSDIVIGSGFVDLVIKSNGNDYTNVSTPYADQSITTVRRSIKQNLPAIEEIVQYEGTISTPGELHFCSYGIRTTSKQEKELKKTILQDKYMQTGVNYEYSNGSVSVHGPLPKDKPEDLEVFIATEDNVQFTHERRYVLKILSDDKISLENLYTYFIEELDTKFDFNIEFNQEEEVISLSWGFDNRIYFVKIDDGIRTSIRHTSEETADELEQLIFDCLDDVRDRFDVEIEIKSVPQTPLEESLSDTWVLDTNSLYRQKYGEDYTSIVSFILKSRLIFGKHVIVPWNVVCEINRHKDKGSSSTQNASRQGVDNLQMLRLLDKTGFLELTVEDIPETIDNSIDQTAGASDLAILNSVPEDGTLITSDKMLSKIAMSMGVHTQNIKEINKSEQKDEKSNWNKIDKKLSNKGPLKKQKIIESLEDTNEQESSKNEKSPEKQISSKLNENAVVRTIISDEPHIAKAQVKKVTPTTSLINNLVNNIVELEGDCYLNDHALNKIRRSVGGISSNNRPKLVFVIPVQYVYRYSEMNQIESLEKLQNLANSEFRTNNNNNVETYADSTIENAVIKTSNEQESVILCNPDEEIRKYNLLGIDFKTVDL